MEFLEIVIMIFVCYLLWKKPEKESLATKLMLVVYAMIVFFFFQGGSHVLPYISL